MLGHTDSIFVCVGCILFSGDGDPRFCGLKWALCGSTKPSQEGSPSSYHIFPSRSQGVALFKAASSPSGTCLRLAVCPCGGHLALCLAATMCGFSTSTW